MRAPKEVEVRNQADLDRVLLAGDIAVCREGDLSIETRGVEHPQIIVVTAAAHLHVVARESSQPHVVAWAYTQLQVFGRVAVKAAKSVAVCAHGTLPRVRGGSLIRIPAITTPQKWCAYYGLDVRRGMTVVYKAVGDDFRSPHGADYTPGTVPAASDWDGGKVECGGGLHFSPSPTAAKFFNAEAKRFVACPVRLEDMRHPSETDAYPAKIKAARCAAPVWECGLDGDPVVAPAQEGAEK